MDLFLNLFLQLLPVYTILILGFIGSRFLKIKADSIAKILIYFLIPIVAFNALAKAKFDSELFFLPILIYLICCLICFLAFSVSKLFYSDQNRNLIALASSYGNFGYFAIPAAISIFGLQIQSLVIFLGLGFQLYQDTVGYYIISNGNNTIWSGLKKLASYPSIYAIALGIFTSIFFPNLALLEMPEYNTLVSYTLSTMIFLGTFVVGLSAGNIKILQIDWKFNLITYFFKFVLWPALAFIFYFLDKNFFEFYSDQVLKLFVFMSLIPMAANVNIFATQLKLETEKVAVTIIFSYLVVLILIPLVMSFLS